MTKWVLLNQRSLVDLECTAVVDGSNCVGCLRDSAIYIYVCVCVSACVLILI